MWARWEELVAQADDLDVHVAEPPPDISYDEMVARAGTLKQAIAQTIASNGATE